jgi:hypothetical protein
VPLGTKHSSLFITGIVRTAKRVLYNLTCKAPVGNKHSSLSIKGLVRTAKRVL